MTTVSSPSCTLVRKRQLLTPVCQGFDLRPFVYPSYYQGNAFQMMNQMVEKLERESLQTREKHRELQVLQ